MNIGDFIQGGILFYTGTTSGTTGITFGLIAAMQDTIIPLYWGCYQLGISGTSTAIGTGSGNTLLIVNSCTGNTMIAANVCSDYSFSGYTDWFLASRDELNQLYLQQNLVGEFDIYNNYWSSSQFMPETAWMQFFKDGTQGHLGGKGPIICSTTYQIYDIKKASVEAFLF